jgi:hypothetical protein
LTSTSTIDAGLSSCMAAAGVPGAVAQARVFDLGEVEAAPFASGRQARAALAAKLVGEGHLPTGRVAEDVRAEFAVVVLIGTDDLLAAEYRTAEELVSGAGHRSLRSKADLAAAAERTRRRSIRSVLCAGRVRSKVMHSRCGLSRYGWFRSRRRITLNRTRAGPPRVDGLMLPQRGVYSETADLAVLRRVALRGASCARAQLMSSISSS